MKKIISWIKSKWAEFKNSQAYEDACKMASFLALALWFVGVVGGIGYACYCKAYVIAIGVAFVGLLSWPVVKDLYKLLTK